MKRHQTVWRCRSQRHFGQAGLTHSKCTQMMDRRGDRQKRALGAQIITGGIGSSGKDGRRWLTHLGNRTPPIFYPRQQSIKKPKSGSRRDGAMKPSPHTYTREKASKQAGAPHANPQTQRVNQIRTGPESNEHSSDLPDSTRTVLGRQTSRTVETVRARLLRESFSLTWFSLGAGTALCNRTAPNLHEKVINATA